MAFFSESFGKWILAGEHSVLRGGLALVFPLKGLSLKLQEESDQGEFSIVCRGVTGSEYQMLVYGLLDRACELLDFPRQKIFGKYILTTDLPLGGGLGASAALCVGVGRLLAHKGLVKEENLYEFCRNLENLFHGESSGVDIAVSLAGNPLKFLRNGPREDFKLNWKPHLYLSYSGQRGLTQECINKVKALLQTHPEQGQKIDEQMIQAVQAAVLALDSKNINVAQEQLAQAIKQAGQCFEAWGLTQGAPESLMMALTNNGSLAVKPTGSGGGGYVLSLWSTEPSAHLKAKFNLISCF